MADLLVQYTAPLPPNYRSGTLTLKRSGVYIDAAGRKAQAVQHGTILADRSVIDVQTGFPMRTIAAADGDPAGPDIDWIETLYVVDTQGALLPDPLRQTRRIPGVYTSAGNLNLHLPDEDADLVNGPKLALTIEGVRAAADLASEAARVAVDDMREATAATYAAVLEGHAAAAEALAAAGINPAYVSETTADPPAAPENTKGAKRNADGSLQRLIRTAGQWVAAGAAVLTLSALRDVDARAWYIFPDSNAFLTSTNLQLALDTLPAGTNLDFLAGRKYNLGKDWYLNKSDFHLRGNGTIFSYVGSSRGGVIHGAPLDRTLTGNAWGYQLLEHAYEAVTPIRNVVLQGITHQSGTGAQTGTELTFYFADDCAVRGGGVLDSWGTGVSFRNCVRPRMEDYTLDNVLTFCLFNYQSHGLRVRNVTARRSGLAWDIKQRHKFFSNVDVDIDGFVLEDMYGFPRYDQPQHNPFWFAGGRAFNELASAAPGTYTANAIANRNFPGHEIVDGVRIRHGTMRVTAASNAGLVFAPNANPGCFARNWTIEDVRTDGGGRISNLPTFILGSAGDISRGQTGGAAFGGNHRVLHCRVENTLFTGAAKEIVQYGVSCTVDHLTVRGVTASRVINQPAVTYLPFGTVAEVNWTNNDIEVTAPLGAIAEGVIAPREETLLFRTGGNRLVVTPINNPDSPGNTTMNPVAIRAARVEGGDGDTIEVLANAAATAWASTYGVYLKAASGWYGGTAVKVQASTNVFGLLAAPPAGNTLELRPVTLELIGTPSGSRTAVQLTQDVRRTGGDNVLVGSWTTTLLDSTSRNATVNPGRTTYGTAPPTTGTHAVGDVRINPVPTVKGVERWECTTAGTPGVWTAQPLGAYDYGDAIPTMGTYPTGFVRWRTGAWNLGQNPGWICYVGGTPGSWTPLPQAGIRQASGRPTYAPQSLGEVAYDTLYKMFWRAKGTVAADWMPETAPPAASITWDAPSIPANSVVSTTLTISPATLTDFVDVSCDSLRTPGIFMDAQVNKSDNSTGNITLTLYNVTSAAIDPPSRNYYFVVRPRA